jgi:hypothetical protein
MTVNTHGRESNSQIMDLLRTKRSADCEQSCNNIARNSLCPWHYQLDIDYLRRPVALHVAVCDSEIPRSGQHQGLKCKSINRDINVRRQTIDQKFTWTTETIHVGCTAVFDCDSC